MRVLGEETFPLMDGDMVMNNGLRVTLGVHASLFNCHCPTKACTIGTILVKLVTNH